MTIINFILSVLESEEYNILYDKSIRNDPNLKEKEVLALTALMNLVKKHFNLNLSVSQMRNQVNKCLQLANVANYNENVSQTILQHKSDKGDNYCEDILSEFEKNVEEDEKSEDERNHQTVDRSAKINALKAKILKRKLKKMEKKFQMNLEQLLQNNQDDSYTLPFFCEKFTNVDPTKETEYLIEILSTINYYSSTNP